MIYFFVSLFLDLEKHDYCKIKQPENNFLSQAEILAIVKAHRLQKDKRIADRLKCVLLLNKGFSFLEIAELLLLDEDTIRRNYSVYYSEGLAGLQGYNYSTPLSYLSSLELNELEQHLICNTYLYSKDIKHYIQKTYGVVYTVEGIRVLLKRLNFVYKKTKHLPGKGDLEKQYAFEKTYNQLKSGLSNEDEIYFMDGVHPLHNSINCRGWIKKGSEKAIKANTGRDRLNINGAVNVAKTDVIIHADVSVNAQSTIMLFDKMLVNQPQGTLHIIADNARYYRSNLVAEYLKTQPRINLIFLPPYSPNLNLIERYWRFFKQKILYGKHYQTFLEFKNETLNFFENIKLYTKELATLLADNFYFPLARFS